MNKYCPHCGCKTRAFSNTAPRDARWICADEWHDSQMKALLESIYPEVDFPIARVLRQKWAVNVYQVLEAAYQLGREDEAADRN